MHNEVLLLRAQEAAPRSFRSGVSLHGHTRHSRESLGFIGKFLGTHRCLRSWIERQKVRCQHITGIQLDFDRAYWTPPLCERQAWMVESGQIQKLGLRPMVSLTDHNSIDAPLLLRQSPEHWDTPISTEWTVPFGHAAFHIGVHNLPHNLAQSFMAAFRDATETAHEPTILQLLSDLNRIPGVLLVFNHPVWNFNGIAPGLFASELSRFLGKANRLLHGFELNGMRSQSENRQVLLLAEQWEQVLISGGDRHACEPNAAINLTNAADFPEFVDEIRNARRSTVLLMPQYAEPLHWRFFQSFLHIIDEYPQHPERRRRWDERTFHPDIAGELVPMIDLWHDGEPLCLRRMFALAALAVNFPMRAVSGAWMSGKLEPLLLPGSGHAKTGIDEEICPAAQLAAVQLGPGSKEYS